MRRTADFFAEQELDLIYMARTLRDALRLEDLLAAAGIDYLVETGNYTAGFLIKRELTGAFFYVAPQKASEARSELVRRGYRPYGKRDSVADDAVLDNRKTHS